MTIASRETFAAANLRRAEMSFPIIKLPQACATIGDLRAMITAQLVPANSWCFRRSPPDGTSTLYAFCVRGQNSYYIVNAYMMHATTGKYTGNGSGGATTAAVAKAGDEYYVASYPEG